MKTVPIITLPAATFGPSSSPVFHGPQFGPTQAEFDALKRENAELRQCAAKLAIFARAYRSHPKRNPTDELDSSLAQFEALIR